MGEVVLTRVRVAVAVLVLLCCVAPVCRAQELARSASFSVDNDYLDFWIPPRQRTDNNYTQGMRGRYDLAAAPARARRLWCAAGEACGAAVEIGQEMYTPTYESTDPIPGQRSFAGWLYAKGTVTTATASRRRSLELTAGVTGPPSLAEPAQEQFHRTFGFPAPIGWAHQLPTEPDVGATLTQEYRLALPMELDRWIELRPSAHAALGTLRVDAGGGVTSRVGVGLTHPWLASGGTTPLVEAYLIGGAHGEAVARDLFLDGATFRSSVRVERRPLVGTWERGAGARVDRLLLEYLAVTTSREYRDGPPTHTVSTIRIGWRP